MDKRFALDKSGKLLVRRRRVSAPFLDTVLEAIPGPNPKDVTKDVAGVTRVF